MKTSRSSFSRRSFLALAGAAPIVSSAAQGKQVPIGLELYSVREELKQDLMGTVRAVAKLGYQDVEFYAPYFRWTDAEAKDVRKLLDDLGIRCLSTHNDAQSFSAENLPRAIELNQIIGSKLIVMAHPGKVPTNLDGWKGVAEHLNQAADKLKPLGLRAGYHNHEPEFKPIEGKRPIEVLAANTVKDVVLQLDVGTCLAAGSDPVAWIDKNPGRIVSMHCKDWSPDKGYKVLFGEGVAPWRKIFAAAESTGGIEFYLIEQEGSAYPPMETAGRCLKTFQQVHG
ncbi:MAG TPA: sugar phosphate isomerase/epimerase family protein [Bryobacteraceae bacterium]|nr:sugar phosphate isomerase/epimerase family protein [Bryobacteraceae bacterium]